MDAGGNVDVSKPTDLTSPPAHSIEEMAAARELEDRLLGRGWWRMSPLNDLYMTGQSNPTYWHWDGKVGWYCHATDGFKLRGSNVEPAFMDRDPNYERVTDPRMAQDVHLLAVPRTSDRAREVSRSRPSSRDVVALYPTLASGAKANSIIQGKR